MKRNRLSLFLVCVSTPLFAAGGAEPRMTGLFENEDCTDIFYNGTFVDRDAGEEIDRYVDVIAGAGVTVLLCNTNARRTNYRSNVWESFWDGYAPDGPDDQPFLASLPAEKRKQYRKLIHNMYEVHRQGVDYPARVIQRCRHHGISPWISLRMNDVHCNDNLDHPFHGDLWRKENYFRTGHPGYFARGLDYAHPEVRDHYMALVKETLHRYDIDGLELDLMREPYLFSKGGEQDGGKILTRWIEKVRKLVDSATAQRGHPIKLGVRVPFKPETALGLGLDAPTWAQQGLVDLVVPTPRWRTMTFDLQLQEWRNLLGNRVTLAGGLLTRYHPYPGGPLVAMDPENAVGAAVSVLASGGDAVYLFNHFQNGRWPVSQYQSLLRRFSSLKELCKLPRRHAVTVPEITVPGQDSRAPLPATGTALSFNLPLGPRPPTGWGVTVLIEAKEQAIGTAPPVVAVNGEKGELLDTEISKTGKRLVTYSVPVDALSGEGHDQITVTCAEGKPIKVFRVEVRMAEPQAES